MVRKTYSLVFLTAMVVIIICLSIAHGRRAQNGSRPSSRRNNRTQKHSRLSDNFDENGEFRSSPGCPSSHCTAIDSNCTRAEFAIIEYSDGDRPHLFCRGCTYCLESGNRIHQKRSANRGNLLQRFNRACANFKCPPPTDNCLHQIDVTVKMYYRPCRRCKMCYAPISDTTAHAGR